MRDRNAAPCHGTVGASRAPAARAGCPPSSSFGDSSLPVSDSPAAFHTNTDASDREDRRIAGDPSAMPTTSAAGESCGRPARGRRPWRDHVTASAVDARAGAGRPRLVHASGSTSAPRPHRSAPRPPGHRPAAGEVTVARGEGEVIRARPPAAPGCERHSSPHASAVAPAVGPVDEEQDGVRRHARCAACKPRRKGGGGVPETAMPAALGGLPCGPRWPARTLHASHTKLREDQIHAVPQPQGTPAWLPPDLRSAASPARSGVAQPPTPAGAADADELDANRDRGDGDTQAKHEEPKPIEETNHSGRLSETASQRAHEQHTSRTCRRQE